MAKLVALGRVRTSSDEFGRVRPLVYTEALAAHFTCRRILRIL